jgi:tetratricopeptide (TPR) repeat protein
MGLALAAGVVSWACTERGPSGSMRRAFEKGDYAEAIALGRHALRSDTTDARVYLYYGMALVARDRLYEGFAAIDEAVERDPDTAKIASEFLWSEATALDATAARRVAKASELTPSLDLGPRRFAVADVYYTERRYEDAAKLYAEATKAYPDSAACERALARLAECYVVMGKPGDSRRTMETLVARYPRGEQAREAWVRLDDLSYADAQAALDRGDFARAAEVAKELVDRTKNRSLQQKGRFVLGSAYEGLGDAANAYAAYRDIIQNDRGDSGGVVQRARGRIEALQGAGLH